MALLLQVAKKLIFSHQISRRFAKRVNPGLNYQISAIEDAAKAIQSDPEGFAGLESDLFNAHKSHKEHELELKRRQEKVRQHLVKNKYFRKDPLPNLLTYAEKEHIRYLHSRDEEDWTVEKLAESFPANAEIISKILKARWNPISSKRIRFHDASVLRNWQRFKNGEYKALMTKELDEHLKKFADRSVSDMQISQNNFQTLPKKQWQKPCSYEFSSIISLPTKRNDTEEKNLLLEAKPTVQKERVFENHINCETYLQGEIKNKKPITIHQLKHKHMLNTNEDLAAGQKNEFMSTTGIIDKKNSTSTQDTDFTQKFISNEVIITEFDRKLYGITETKQRIHIPRKLWRKGATYRTNNCYYDDDGELLYKVPVSLQ